jgi:hypothetical protein
MLHEFLDERGEIERTQRLMQLGLVQSAWPIARHTRWDFTMLLLDLIRRTKDLPGIHVGSQVRVSTAFTVSSARELLNAWALLLNLGHLHGTFTTESEILFAIKRSPDRTALETELLRTVPPTAQAFADRVLQEERTYTAHQLFAFYRLARIGKGSPHLVLWQQLLAAYVAQRPEESLALSRSRELFRKARRLAFMSLDASLTPGALQIRLGELSSVPEALERLLAPGEGLLSRRDELQSLEEYLSREVYNGKEVLRVVASGRPLLRRSIESGLRQHGLRYVVESAAKTIDHSYHRPRNSVRPVVRGVIAAPFMQIVLEGTRLRFARRRLEDGFARWGKVLGAEVSLIFVQDAAGSQLIYQTHVHQEDEFHFACAIAGAIQLHERLRHLVRGTPPISGIEQLIFEGSAQGILNAALRHFFVEPSHWEWGSATGRHICVAGSRDEVERYIDEALDTAGISRARLTELRALRARLHHIRATTLFVALGNLIAYGHDKVSQLAEVDGLVLGLDNRRSDLTLTVIEAKSTNGAASLSRKQLEMTIKQLGPRRGLRRGSIQNTGSGSRGHAWMHLRSHYART